jgi:nucleoside-diphosphate-sugar epimerase
VDQGQWVTTVRPAAIYGPGDPERFYHIFKRVARGSFTFLGNGSALYHPLYIDNLVDAMIQAGEADGANGQSYLIADEEYVPIRDLVARTAKALNVPIKMRFLPFWPAYAVAAVVETALCPLPCRTPNFSTGGWTGSGKTAPSTSARPRGRIGYVPKVGLDEGATPHRRVVPLQNLI